jgi:LmbE family N-acetylglucosaminyl deacetylase
MARAVVEGHRVVLVTATRGERGLDRAGVVPSGETLAERRESELRQAVSRLGVDVCQVLGYVDSGIDVTRRTDSASSRPSRRPNGWRPYG